LARHSPDEFAVCVISLHEQVSGCQSYISQAKSTAELVRRYRLLGIVLNDFCRLPMLPFDPPAGTVYDQLKSQRLGVASMDLRIAAIAILRGLTLLTRNRKDFGKVPGLQIEDWTV
jgi:tRNA(fMet)-specific endonuclease VapC